MFKAVTYSLLAIQTASAATDCYSHTKQGQSACLTYTEAGENCAWCHSASSGDSCMKESDAQGLPTSVFQCTYKTAAPAPANDCYSHTKQGQSVCLSSTEVITALRVKIKVILNIFTGW